VDALLRPAALRGAAEVLLRPCPVPAAAGIYAWYFPVVPRGVPTDGCHVVDGATLLYVGISPSAPAANGKAPSKQTVRQRLRIHLRGNASSSTLRLTLGCLLADELGTTLRLVGKGRLTFGAEGETRLNEWLVANARLAWAAVERPWEIEHQLIKTVVLPLNLDQNRHSPFHQTLSGLRAEQRARARALTLA